MNVVSVQALVSSITTVLNTSLHFGLMLLASFPTIAAGSRDYNIDIKINFQANFGKYFGAFTVTSISGYSIIYYFGWT